MLLLSVPGPTNTLLFLAGREKGIAGSLLLPLAEMTDYLLVIIPFMTAFAPLIAENPCIVSAFKLVAAGWLIFLSYRLVRNADSEGNGAPTFGTVFTTTILNPKALILALVVFTGEYRLGSHVAVFLAILVPVSTAWITLGRLSDAFGRDGENSVFGKGTAGCLVVFAIALALSGISG
jgi:threonine/homoserine/homoserine lactone efflux protein